MASPGSVASSIRGFVKPGIVDKTGAPGNPSYIVNKCVGVDAGVSVGRVIGVGARISVGAIVGVEGSVGVRVRFRVSVRGRHRIGWRVGWGASRAVDRSAPRSLARLLAGGGLGGNRRNRSPERFSLCRGICCSYAFPIGRNPRK